MSRYVPIREKFLSQNVRRAKFTTEKSKVDTGYDLQWLNPTTISIKAPSPFHAMSNTVTTQQAVIHQLRK